MGTCTVYTRADKVFPDVTLANADLALLQCWNNKVSKGVKCSLTLKHSKGRVTTILKSSSPRIMKPMNPTDESTLPSISIQADKKRQKKGNKKKRLEALISFQERLVKEKGLPPSRIMLEHAAAAAAAKSSSDLADLEENSSTSVKCDKCEFKSNSQDEVRKHMNLVHNDQCNPDTIAKPTETDLTLGTEDIMHGEDIPPSKFSCPSCLATFPTEHSLSRHIYVVLYDKGKGEHYPSDWNGCDVNCRICKHTSSSCAAMVEHVENEHKRTSSLIPRLQKHYSGILVAESDQCNSYCRKVLSKIL